MTTCMESSNNIAYMFDNLLGEVGELAEKVNTYIGQLDLAEATHMLSHYGVMAKFVRKSPDTTVARIERDNFSLFHEQMANDDDLHKELGDILWQLSGLCHVLGISLEDVARQNLEKLASRKQRNVIDGEGDNR